MIKYKNIRDVGELFVGVEETWTHSVQAVTFAPSETTTSRGGNTQTIRDLIATVAFRRTQGRRYSYIATDLLRSLTTFSSSVRNLS